MRLMLELRRSPLEPAVISSDAALSACEKEHSRSGLSLRLEIRRSRLEPFVISCNKVISACGRYTSTVSQSPDAGDAVLSPGAESLEAPTFLPPLWCLPASLRDTNPMAK